MKVGDLLINESEIVESFVRSSGPGGQNVNKVASAVELRFAARRSPSLPDEVATKLMKLAGSRLTQDGVIVIFAQRFSSQPRNREDARERLAALIAKAQQREKPRRPTRPTLAAKARRLDEKGRRGAIKALRGKAGPEERRASEISFQFFRRRFRRPVEVEGFDEAAAGVHEVDDRRVIHRIVAVLGRRLARVDAVGLLDLGYLLRRAGQADDALVEAADIVGHHRRGVAFRIDGH